MTASATPSSRARQAMADTERWLDRAVIGLNLCPFAKAVRVRGQIHFTAFEGEDEDELMQRLMAEAQALRVLPATERDTTLLVLPFMLEDFRRFNAFTQKADRRLRKLGFEGELQLASFHPLFEFADAPPESITHATNRSPYPILHLLREESVERAVQSFPDAEAIYGRNMATLEALGSQGWAALGVGASQNS